MDAKKFLLVLAACFLILFLHKRIGDYLWPPETEKPPAKTTEAPQDTPPDAVITTPEPTPQADRETKPKPGKVAIQPQLIQGRNFILVVKDADQLQEQTVLLGSRQRGSGFNLEVQLTTDAASITQAWLTEFAGDSDEYKYAQSPYGQGRTTPVGLLSPVAGRFKLPEDDQALPPCKYSLATSRLLFIAPKSQQNQPGRQVLAAIDAFPWKLAERGKNWVRFETTVQLLQADQDKVLAELTLRKTFTVLEESYDLQVKIELTLSQDSDGDYTIELIQDGPTGMGLESARGDMRAGIYAQRGTKGVEVKTVSYGGIEKEPGGVALSDPTSGDLLWAGAMNKFFGAFLVPESDFTAPDNPDAPKVASVFKLVRILPILDPDTGKAGNVLARLVAPAIQLRPGQTRDLNMKLFLGPKQRKLLKS
ncbi:MAG: YidC/Oxa1 family insertase periplasmic-domain containing protein, partial [Phycisphaerae bacterium]|nr:YidC/Oxa1 family insertase periplasmic-domain containing protein [Phycisphaerae bacterium]